MMQRHLLSYQAPLNGRATSITFQFTTSQGEVLEIYSLSK